MRSRWNKTHALDRSLTERRASQKNRHQFDFSINSNQANKTKNPNFNLNSSVSPIVLPAAYFSRYKYLWHFLYKFNLIFIVEFTKKVSLTEEILVVVLRIILIIGWEFKRLMLSGQATSDFFDANYTLNQKNWSKDLIHGLTIWINFNILG